MVRLVMNPWQVVFHVKCVPERSEDKKNPCLRGGSMKLYSREGLLGMRPKSNVG